MDVKPKAEGVGAIFESHLVKAWLIISVLSLFLYGLIQLVNSVVGTGYSLGFGAFVELYNYLTGYSSWSVDFILGHVFAELGVFIRLAGLTLALLSVCLVFMFGKTWLDVKRKIALAVGFEGLFFIGLLGVVPMMMRDQYIIFAWSYGIQFVLTTPFLVALSLKIRRSSSLIQGFTAKFLGLAFLGYVCAMWVNNILRWGFMASIMGIEFLFAGTTSVGFFSAAVFLTCALVFAAVGLFSIMKHKAAMLTGKLFGLSLCMIGTYFTIYLIYSIIENALGSIMLVEIWALPLLGLGLSIIYAAAKLGKGGN